MWKSFKFKCLFFVIFPSFTRISILHCLHKAFIKHTVFLQIISLAEDIVNGYICFFNFPAGNLIYYCRFYIKTVNITNDISVYNALPCNNVLEESAFEWNVMTASNLDLKKFLSALQKHKQESREDSNRVQCLVSVSAKHCKNPEWFRPILF